MAKPAILCVDDEKMILDSLKTQLKTNFGTRYLYEVAENAADAMEIIDELSEDGMDAIVIVIVSDWLMPGMKGDEFLIRIHEKYPNIVTVLLDTPHADAECRPTART